MSFARSQRHAASGRAHPGASGVDDLPLRLAIFRASDHMWVSKAFAIKIAPEVGGQLKTQKLQGLPAGRRHPS